MSKVLIVCTTDSMIWHFLIPHITALQEEGYQVECACSRTGFYLEELRNKYSLNINELVLSRSPFRADNLLSLLKIKKLIDSRGYDIIYCHEPVGGVLGRLAGKICKKKVFYAAHGFHFNKGGPLKNWMLYYPAERWLARYTDVLITINNEDYEKARRFKAKKVSYLPGVGLDIERFSNTNANKIIKREKIGIPETATVLVSVGELNANKNHETVIRALARLKNPSILYFICGNGELFRYLNELCLSLRVENQVKTLGYLTDVTRIYQIADIFVFPSRREGLPVAVMEAMAAGLPVVCSNIRGNNELIDDNRGGYLVPPNDVDAYIESISKLIENREQCRHMGEYNINKIGQHDVGNIINDVKVLFKDYA